MTPQDSQRGMNGCLGLPGVLMLILMFWSLSGIYLSPITFFAWRLIDLTALLLAFDACFLTKDPTAALKLPPFQLLVCFLALVVLVLVAI